MTKKQALQKELLEKVKPGTKPPHLKKLKRSKSDSDIPKAPPLPLSEMEQLKKENEQLKQEAQATAQRLKGLHDFAKSGNASSPTNPSQALSTLTEELKKQTDLNALLTDQLKAKHSEIELLRQQEEDSAKQIEELRKDLEETHPISNELSELDQSLISRHKSLKDWFIQYGKNKELDQELEENIEQASEELISQDKKISHLQNQIIKLKQTNQSLQKDLNLSQRLAELRKSPLPNSETETYGKSLIIGLFLALWLISLLNAAWKQYNFKDN